MNAVVTTYDERDIELAEAVMLDLPQVECPTVHHFGPGIYIREMRAPKGTILLGHAHKTDHTSVLLQGSLTFSMEDGSTQTFTAPHLFNSSPGRKLALVLSDVVFLNIHPNPTGEEDVQKLEGLLIEKSPTFKSREREEYSKCLGSQQRLLEMQ